MRQLLTILILVVGAILIFVFPVQGIFKSLEPARMQIADLNEALFNAGQIQLRRDELQDQYNSFPSEDLAKLDKLLPSHVDSVRLIIDINNIARENGLVINDITVGEERAEGQDDEEAITVATTGVLFDTLRLSIKAEGSYPAFKNFLKDVERSLRIVDLVSLSFELNEDPLVPEGTYNFDTVIETYWLKETAE